MFKIKNDKNDELFSIMIRERDGKCVFCGKTAPEYKMTNSHFWGRADKIHRFDPLNCDTLCFMCHMKNESNKQGMYKDWKRAQLGDDLYDSMERAHYQKTKKYGKYEADLLFTILTAQYESKEHLKPGWKVVW